MAMSGSLPLLVQSDGTLLLDARDPLYEEAAEALRPVAELSKRPGFLHTYRLTPVSLWNAAAAGESADAVVERLAAFSRFGLPEPVEREIRDRMESFGKFRLVRTTDGVALEADTPERLAMAALWPEASRCFASPPCGTQAAVLPEMRGVVKRELAARGWPVLDEAGYRRGGVLDVTFRSVSVSGKPVRPRDYQLAAADAFLARSADGGGIAVLPCGAGKTWVGMAAMVGLRCETLILTPNTMSVSQWMRELIDNTSLSEGEIGEYTGQVKDVRPVTVATYQVLTHRKSAGGGYPHWKLFGEREWGLIIYDEVHLLPAPVFRMTAELQATRRLGLTATLVREDGLESDVFALIGPKRFELGWKRMEREGTIAGASCTEIRVPFDERTAVRYRQAQPRSRHRIAGENPVKAEAVRWLMDRYRGVPTLVIGQYLDQLRRLSAELGLPLVTGEMPHAERRRMFDRFNCGELPALLVSKVANFAVDLPDATVGIQVSGSFGSRQEEAQRLGRILRPKRSGGKAAFYTLVSEGTDEVEFARNRSRFLVEQGYAYEVSRWEPSQATMLAGIGDEVFR